MEDDILRDVARRISKMETLTPTANWQLWRYQQTEAVRQDVIKKLARYTGRSEAEIRRLMQEAATRALDRAHLKVSSGAFDYKSAVKSAVDSLADTMKYVTYPTGHTDTLEVACRRAVLTGVNQTAGKLQVARADTSQSNHKKKSF